MRYFLLPTLALLGTITSAQWATPPDPPLAISTAENEQKTVRAISDGGDGWYVLWLDGRVSNSKREVYGQHLNAAGVPQWEADGRQLLAHPDKNIGDYFSALTPTGDLFTVWVQGGDTLVSQLLDAQGSPVWPEPALVAGRTNNNAYSIGQPRLVLQEGGAIVSWMPNHQGGNPQVAFNRVALDGEVLHGFNGTYIPGSGYGGHGIVTDGYNGAYIWWASANAMGASIRVRRVNADGELQWAQHTVPTTGTSGIHDGEYTGTADGAGGLVVAWNSNSDILMSRIDTSGAFIWDPAVKPVCTNTASQRRPVLAARDGHIFSAWSDGRPPADNYDLFVQKFNLDGDPLWTVDGVLAIHENTYIPHARIAPTADGGAYVSHKTGVGFQAMLLNGDGMPVWEPAFTMTPANYAPFYGDQRMLPTNDGGAVLFWATDGNNIYGTRVDPGSGISTGIAMEDHGLAAFSFHPNPASDRITIPMEGALIGSEVEFELYDALGKRVHSYPKMIATDDTVLQIPSEIKNGIYLLSARSEETTPLTTRIVVQR